MGFFLLDDIIVETRMNITNITIRIQITMEVIEELYLLDSSFINRLISENDDNHSIKKDSNTNLK